MFAITPTALSTISHSMTSSPFCVLTVTLQPEPEVSTEVTSAEVFMLIPCFFKERPSCFPISLSSTGTTLSIYSTTVTSVPMAL